MVSDNANRFADAFGVLLDEIEAQITLASQDGAHAFEQRNYDHARQALERAKQLGAFRDRVRALRRDWEKILNLPAGVPPDEGLLPRHFLRREFWHAFMQRAAGRAPLPARLGKAIRSGISAPTGARQLWWDYSIRMHDAGLALSIYREDASENKRLFDALFARREEIEQAFDAPLVWDRYDQGRGSYIRCTVTGGGLQAREDWPEIQERMIQTMVRFKRALDPEIRELPGIGDQDRVPQPDDTDEGLLPRHFLRREFWQAFMQRAAGRAPLPARLGKGIYGRIYVPTNKRRVYWETSIRMHDAGLDLAIYRPDAAENRRLYDHLSAHREEIEHAFGAPLEWDRNEQGLGCVIRYRLAGGGLLEREAWPEIQERMIETMVRFQKALGPAIAELPD